MCYFSVGLHIRYTIIIDLAAQPWHSIYIIFFPSKFFAALPHFAFCIPLHQARHQIVTRPSQLPLSYTTLHGILLRLSFTYTMDEFHAGHKMS